MQLHTFFGKAFCTLVLEVVYFSIQEMIVQMCMWIGGNLPSMVSLLGFMLHMLKSQPWSVCAYRTRMPPARSFSFIVAHHWPHAMFALIYCLLRKTCDYSPTTTTYKKKSFYVLSGTKAIIGPALQLWEEVSAYGTLLIRVNSVKCNPPTLAIPPTHPTHTHIPSGVTRITSFSPNGHFGWQVHYTLYFQIVCPLLMPGRLIALAASPGKGLTSTAGTSWKTVITVFL